MSTLASTLSQHGFSITSRAAGVAALLCSSAAVGVGVSMGGKLVKGRTGDLRVLHESLSLATIVALVVHAHHLLDPATRRPAFIGIVQVTAIAPTAFAAELRAKTALLSGPGAAPACLPDGGVIVADDGSWAVV